MVEAFEKHFHASLADFFLVDAHGGERRVHEHALFPIVETHQADFFGHLYSATAQGAPEAVGNLVVAGDDCGRARTARQNARDALLAKIHETRSVACRDQDRFQSVFTHGLTVTLKTALHPGVGDVTGEMDAPMAAADQVMSGAERGGEIVKADLVELVLPVHADNVIAESNERHVDGSDPAEEVRINGAGENDSVNQAMFLQNRRQVYARRRGSRGIMQRGEEHMLFQPAGVGLDTLEDARMKGMKEIAIAQEKADHAGAALENPAGLSVGPELQTLNGFEDAGASFAADLGTGIEHAGNCADAHTGGARNLANRHATWNNFHRRSSLG